MPTRTRNKLSHYREQGGFLVFRIAASPDFQATVSELRQRIPSWARRFDTRTSEWRVKVEYRDVIEEMFGPAPQQGAARESRGGDYVAESQHGQWLWIVLTIAIIATVGALLWSRGPQFVTAVQPEPTLVPGPLSATPAPQVTTGARVAATANLREGPGTHFAVREQIQEGTVVEPEARTFAEDGFWWLQLQSGAWIRSDLIVANDDNGLPYDLSRLPDIGSNAGTPGVAPTVVALAAPTLPPPIEGESRGVVTWIYDGDTASVQVGGSEYKVRYLGIDSPEIDMPGHDEATQANRDLVMGETVILRPDVTNVDRYGRLLRYLYLDDGTFVNQALVESGWAIATDFPPDTLYINELMDAQDRARRQGLGLWED